MISNMLLHCSSFLPTNYALITKHHKLLNQKVCPSTLILTPKTIHLWKRPTSVVTCANAHADQMLSISKDIASNNWTNYFLNTTPEDEETLAQREQQLNELKEEVKNKLLTTLAQKTMLDQLELINNIQRLGVGYHFENEIEEALNKIYESHLRDETDHDHLDLYHASLLFRLLRQHGFYVSCDMLKKFLDENRKFSASLSGDVEGILSLYEASFLRTHGDEILDEAVTFTTTHLKLMTNKLPHHPLAEMVVHALDVPLHKGVPRIESRRYISFYENNHSHNKILLKFAKLNFNFLQSIHKKEILHLTRWCFDQGMDLYTALPCKVRDQIAAVHYSAMGTVGERPECSLGRTIYFKTCLVGTMIDDLYDECDIEDLELLTEAIQRWDKSCVNILPNNMKAIYTKLLTTFEEIKQELIKEGRDDAFHHAVEAFKILWPAHMQIRKWRREKYVPTFDEYMNTKATTGFKFLTIIAWLGVARISANDVSEWLEHYSTTIEAVCAFYRLMDDIAENYLNVAEELSVVSCYMKQYNVTDKSKAQEDLQKIVDNVWKDINYASLRPSTMPISVLQRFISQAQFLHVGFYRGDGFTFADRTPMKKNYELMFKDPIPI